MSSVLILRGLTFLVLIGSIVQCVLYYPVIPDSIASHFDFYGNPDAYYNKTTFIGIYLGLLYIVTLMLGISSILPISFSSKMVKVPNKEYWMAPPRSAETLSYISTYLMKTAFSTSLFLFSIFELLFEMARRRIEHLHWSFWPMLCAFLAYYVILYFEIRTRFPSKVKTP